MPNVRITPHAAILGTAFRQKWEAIPSKTAAASPRIDSFSTSSTTTNGIEACSPSSDGRPVNLAYENGRLSWPSGSARAAVGKAGVRADKREGDGATPAGSFPLLFGMYRSDRAGVPATMLPMTPLLERHAWVDDPQDPNYNRLVELPYPAHAERLWRDDAIYDLLVVVGYNINPRRPGAGSAIFLHVARSDFLPTAGCIAVDHGVLLRLLPALGTDSMLTIRA
jgi:L,D-peptidoglycan transpeptidase YkuD (ErfK/YbiS/YcfS/YnhG family)